MRKTIGSLRRERIWFDVSSVASGLTVAHVDCNLNLGRDRSIIMLDLGKLRVRARAQPSTSPTDIDIGSLSGRNEYRQLVAPLCTSPGPRALARGEYSATILVLHCHPAVLQVMDLSCERHVFAQGCSLTRMQIAGK